MNESTGAGRFAAGMILFALILIGSGCDETEVQSTWLTEEISIDGSSIDWGGSLQTLGDDQALVGVRNDETHLYVCIVVTPRELQIPILIGGLTLRFETADGEERGFRYPVTTGRNEGPPPRDHGIEGMWERLDKMAEIEILKSEGELNRFVDPGEGLDVAIGEQYGALVYEAKIPLRPEDDSPFHIASNDLDLRVGILTSVSEMRRPGGSPPSGGRSGGGGPGGGGRRGGGGGGRSGGGGGGGHPGGGSFGEQPARPKAIDAWATVHLVAEPE